MGFVTIVEKNKKHPAMYHGIILSNNLNDESFEFAFRVGNINYIWNCRLDYWNLIY